MKEREKAARAKMRVKMEDRRVEGKGGEGRKAEERKDGKGKEKGKRATQAGAKKQTIIPM